MNAAPFHQHVRMASAQVAGLSNEELAQALAYEVEPFSGIPAAEARVAFTRLADDDPTVAVYDVTVTRKSGRGSAAPAARRALNALRLAAVAVLALVAADAFLLHRRVEALRHEVTVRRPLQEQLNRLNAEAAAARTEAAAIRTRREAAVRAQNEAAALRTAHADLLGCLTAACAARAVVTDVAAGKAPGALTIRALSDSAEAAAGTMRRLTPELARHGWHLVPGTIRQNTSGDTTRFDFTLTYGRH